MDTYPNCGGSLAAGDVSGLVVAGTYSGGMNSSEQGDEEQHHAGRPAGP